MTTIQRLKSHSGKEKRGKETAVETVKMQLRRAHEATVSMVPTPRPYATAPHAPADRAQPSSQTLLRPSRPLPQQASKMTHTDDDMLEEQNKFLLSTSPTGII